MFEPLFGLVESGGLFILLILLFLEGNPLVGSFIPGQVLIIIFGFVIATTGIVPVHVAIFLILVAGFLGDLVGYLLGKYSGERFLRITGIKKNSKIYLTSCNFFNKYGALSIVMGRMILITRAFMPFMAGISKMPFSKFVPIALISNLFFSVVSVLVGFYFGHLLLDKIDYVVTFMVFLAIYIMVLLKTYGSFKKFYFKNFYSYDLFAKYTTFSFIFFGSLLIILEVISFTKYSLALNYYFSFIASFSFLLNFNFIFTWRFLLAAFFLISIFALIKGRYKLFISYFWGILLGIGVLIFGNIVLLRLGAQNFYALPVFLVVVTFYIGLLFDSSYFRNFKKPKKSWIVLTILLFFIFWIGVAKSQDFLRVFTSFILGVIISEIILMLSHIGVWDTREEVIRI